MAQASRTVAALAAVLLSGLAPAASGQSALFRVEPIAPPGAGLTTVATDVSDSGWVAGYTFDFTPSDGFGFVRDPATGAYTALQPARGIGAAQPHRVFDNGRTVGTTFVTGLSGTPTVWTAAGAARELRQPFLSGFGLACDASAIGLVVGSSQWLPNQEHPLTWRGSVMHLAPLPPGKSFGRLCAVNGRGLMVGFARATPGGPPEGYVLDAAGTVAPIGLLPGGTFSALNDVNDDGLAVGQASDASGRTRAITWRDGTITPLPPFSLSSSDSLLRVNRRGTAVGASSNPTFQQRPLLLVSGQLVDLNTLLDPATGAGWLVLRATGLNNQGQIVCSARSPTGAQVACLLTPLPGPPE